MLSLSTCLSSVLLALTAVCVGVLAPATSTAQVWRCEVDKKVTYVDHPCPSDVESSRAVDAQISIVPGHVPRTVGGGQGGRVARRDSQDAQSGATRRASSEPNRSQQRSARAVAEFKRLEPCPSTGRSRGSCPGYEIDHRQPLAAGGSDTPDNMQWLTVQQHRIKTQSERAQCVYGCR